MESIVALPDDYVVVDIETTGKNPRWEFILELAAIRYRHDVETGRYEQLVSIGQPVRPFISRLTGITDEMLVGQPTIDIAIRNFADFVGNDIMIGHNIAAFDTIFLADAYEKYLSTQLTNPCVDTLRYAKKLCPKLKEYTLQEVSSFFDIPYKNAHRGATDCEITNACYQKLKQLALSQGSEGDFKVSFIKHSKKIQVNEIVPNVSDLDSSNPLFNKIIVFTGTLSMSRQEAMQLAVNAGAILKTSVTAKTNFLVVGGQDTSRVGDDGMSTKEEKANTLNSSGKANIQIISEQDFLNMTTKN